MAIMDVVIAVVAITMSFFVSLNHGQDLPDIYHGCYFDGVDRALQDLITCQDGMGVCQKSCGDEQTYCEGEEGMTVDFCRGLCRNRNLQYYAVQAGNQCFCGGALSYPFQHTKFTGNQANCFYPCSGDANQTCGGDFKMEIYEFKEPVPGADCFHPGFVPNSHVPDNISQITINDQVTFLCEPGHMILGEPQLTCQTKRAWSPNELPTCKGIFPETPTSEPPPSEPPEPPKKTPLTTTVSTIKDNVIPTSAPTSNQTPTSEHPSTEPQDGGEHEPETPTSEHPPTEPQDRGEHEPETPTSEPPSTEPQDGGEHEPETPTSEPPPTEPQDRGEHEPDTPTFEHPSTEPQDGGEHESETTTSEPLPSEPPKPPKTTPLTTTVSMKSNVPPTALTSTQTTTSEPLPSEPSEPPKTTPLTTTKPPETFISHFFLLLGILVGVASSVITTVLIIFIVKSINRNGPHEATEPRNTKQNSSIVVNPVFNIGRSEEALSGGYNTNGPGREHSYEVNLRGL